MTAPRRKRKKTSSGPPKGRLDDIFPGLRSKKLRQAIETLGRDCEDLEKKYRGRIARLNGKEFETFLELFTDAEERKETISTYLGILFSEDNRRKTRIEDLEKKLEQATVGMKFCWNELMEQDPATIFRKIYQAPSLGKNYGKYLEGIFFHKKRALPRDIELSLEQKEAAHIEPLRKEFKETVTNLEYSVDGENVLWPVIEDMRASPDPAIRKKAHDAVCESLAPHLPRLTEIFNITVQAYWEDCDLRGYSHVDSPMHDENGLRGPDVEMALDILRDAVPRTLHRFHKWRAQHMRCPSVPVWDVTAPVVQIEERGTDWEEATETVLKAIRKVSPTLANKARILLDNDWVDAKSRKYRENAYFVTSLKTGRPHVFIDFTPSISQIKYCAHELGHGVQELLEFSDPTLGEAETISLMFEFLTLEYQIANEKDPEQKKLLLTDMVESALGYTVGEVISYDYERGVYKEGRQSPLSPESMRDLYARSLRKQYGDYVNVPDEKGDWWALQDIIDGTPFYYFNYAYAFCMFSTYYRRYQTAEDKAAFMKDYFLEYLKKGDEVLPQHGIDPSRPEFWQEGIQMVEQWIERLEVLAPPPLSLPNPKPAALPAPLA